MHSLPFRGYFLQYHSQPPKNLSTQVNASKKVIPTLGLWEMTGLVLSSWTLAAIGVQHLKQILWGGWSEQRLQACLPWLLRYFGQRRRKRGHQETGIRAQLLAVTSPLWKSGKELAVA